MGLDIRLNQRLDLQLKLAPQIIQSIELLQLPAMDLLDAIEQELDTNEFLEKTPAERLAGRGATFRAEDIADLRARYPDVPELDVTVMVLYGYVGAGYAVASQAVFDLIAELCRLEGLLLDPVYSGKAFAGMLAEMEAGRFDGVRDIVFVHTGGVFGVFPQRGGFDFN